MDIPEEPPNGTTPSLGLGATLELMPVATVLTDRSGFLTAANTAWTVLTGLDRLESMGVSWMRLLHQDGRTRVLSTLRRSSAGCGAQNLDTELLIRGEPVPARLFFRAGPLDPEPVIAMSVVTGLPDRLRRAPDPAEKEIIEEADAVIRDLFAVGITLNSCAENMGADVGSRLRETVAQLDKVIQRVRRAALTRAISPSPRPEAAGPWAADDRHVGFERLLAEARRALARCQADSPLPANEVQVVDSVQSLHRAIVGLADAMESPSARRSAGKAGAHGGRRGAREDFAY